MMSIDGLFIPILLFCGALLARATFSFIETSVTALRLFKIKELARTTGRYTKLFNALEKQPHRVLITILIANSFADVTTAALATEIMETVFSHFNLSSGLGFSVGIAVATIALLIFGEILPKNLARGRSDRLFVSLLWFINLIYFLFQPFVSLLLHVSNFVMRITGRKGEEEGSEWVSSEREVKFLIKHIGEKGLIEEEKTEMLQNIFDLGTTPVKEIMVPETDIVSVSADTTIRHALPLFAKHYFTRLPVYDGDPDNIIGMVHLKDVFTRAENEGDKPVKDIVRPIMFVPESVKINQLLREFRKQHMHIAMVINEHGSVTGLITLEDVLEEIVGEISDEHEAESEKIVALKKGGWLIDASVDLEELEDLLGIKFEREEVLTLGGFLTEQLQHLPKKGERILYKGYYFQIQKASPKRVLQVLVFEKEPKS